MIHFSSDDTNTIGLCGMRNSPGNLCTPETPRSERDWGRACPQCKTQFDLIREQERIEYYRRLDEYELQQAARPFNERFYDKMVRLASFGENSSDLYCVIPYLVLAACTLGLSVLFVGLAKRFAKLYLRMVKKPIIRH